MTGDLSSTKEPATPPHLLRQWASHMDDDENHGVATALRAYAASLERTGKDSLQVGLSHEPLTEHPPELIAVVDGWQDYANDIRNANRLPPSNSMYGVIECVLRDVRRAVVRPAPPPRAAPVAWLHTLHMDLGQTDSRLTFSAANAWGEQGADYSLEYRVTSEPLYRADPPPPDVQRDAERWQACLRHEFPRFHPPKSPTNSFVDHSKKIGEHRPAFWTVAVETVKGPFEFGGATPTEVIDAVRAAEAKGGGQS